MRPCRPMRCARPLAARWSTSPAMARQSPPSCPPTLPEYLEALEDAADIIAARRALAEQAPSVPADQALGPNLGSTTPCDCPPLRDPVPARRSAADCQISQRTLSDACGPP